MVNEKQTNVGCGIAQFKYNGYFSIYLVCNYAITNILNSPVYTAGSSCSGCTTGCHPTYKGLCSPTEPIVPKPT